MASCTYNPGINSVNPYAVLTVTQKSQDVANNKTIVAYELTLYRPSAISSSSGKPYSITINGVTVKNASTTIGGSGAETIASGTLEVPHNQDGTKTIQFSFSLKFGITWHGVSVGTGTASGTMKLTDIPRATTPTLSPATQEMGKTITIGLPKAVSTFTHTLQHDFYAGVWTTFATQNVGASVILPIPLDWASRIPNAASGGGRIRCLTYNGNTLIGEKIVNFTATVPETVIPVIYDVSCVEAVSGIAAKFGAYIQTRSRLKVSVTAYGALGSSVETYKTEILKNTYAKQTFESGLLTESGRVAVAVTVTDSRGRVGKETVYVDVVEYTNPTINVFKAYRATSSGEAADDGKSLKCEFDFSVSPCGSRNDNTYQIQYKTTAGDYWTTLKTGNSYALESTYLKDTEILAEENTYEVRIVVKDSFVEVVYETEVGTSVVPLDVHPTGRGLAIGKMSQKEAFEVNMPAEFLKSLKLMDVDGNGTNIDLLQSLILEEKTEGIWHYIKWASGRCELYTNITKKSATTDVQVCVLTFPFAIKSILFHNISPTFQSWNVKKCYLNAPSETKIDCCYFTDSAASLEYRFSLFIVGFWK